MKTNTKYEVVVIGTSAGGLQALTQLLAPLPAAFIVPIMVVQHRAKDQGDMLEDVLQQKCALTIKQGDEKEKLKAGCVYVAPPDYHMLVEMDKTLSLSADPPVLYSRPSIDVLFESASVAFSDKLIGILLTGASSDGTKGMLAIKKAGGLTIAQEPLEALFPVMPQSSIDSGAAKKVMILSDIAKFLSTLNRNENGKTK